MSVSPLINSDRKGGAFPIMLQQFRRAIGVCIVRGQAKLKLSRLHYVRETVAEAADICKQIIARIDGTPTRMVALVGSQRTVQWDTGLLNNSEMDMIFLCLRGAQKI